METDHMFTSTDVPGKKHHIGPAGVRATMILCNSALDYNDPDEDVEVTYRFDFRVALKGIRPWHERGLQGCFSIALGGEDYHSLNSAGNPMFVDVPIGDPSGSRDTTYRIRVGIYKQRYRRNRSVGIDHTDHVPVWSDYLVLTTMPKSCASLYSWASEPATSFRDAATLVRGDRMDAIVPVPWKARGVMGSKAILRFEMTN
jgi:hypothetical protein